MVADLRVDVSIYRPPPSSTESPRELPSSQGDAGLRSELRQATSARHAALDRRLVGRVADRSGYIAFLQGSRLAIAGLEPELVRIGVLPASGRLARLDADMAALGATQLLPARGALGTWRPASIASAHGAAYVLEGSSMGGLMLAHVVEKALGRGATSYLRLRGNETMAAWRRFVARLDTWGKGASRDDRRAAIDAATSAFLLYERAFAAAFDRAELDGAGNDGRDASV